MDWKQFLMSNSVPILAAYKISFPEKETMLVILPQCIIQISKLFPRWKDGHRKVSWKGDSQRNKVIAGRLSP